MVMNRVGRAGRWVGLSALACGGVLALVREAPAAPPNLPPPVPPRVKRPAPEFPERGDFLVELGRRLFFEPAITLLGKNSCASCHDPEHGFSDPAVKSRDDFNFTPRHSQTLIDVDLKMPMHWDGSMKDLAEIVQRRTTLPGGGGYSTGGEREFEGVESPLDAITRMGGTIGEPLPEVMAVARDLGPGVSARIPLRDPVAVRDDSDKDGLAPTAPSLPSRYGEAVLALTQNVVSPAAAIEAYVKSLRSNTSAYDRHFEGEDGALSDPAKRGLALFQGRAGCAECHGLEHLDGWASLRDGDYHNTGLAWMSRGVVPKLDAPANVPQQVVSAARKMLKKGDEGRAGIDASDKGSQRAFKTPTLRDVASHPPYMHDGSLATLADVVRHYAKGCGDDPQRDARVRKGFEASETDVADLVAFLESLTSDERPGLAKALWTGRALRTRLVLMDATGVRLQGMRVTLTAVGDRAARAAPPKDPRVLTTDEEGMLTFPPGLTTHVRLGLPHGVIPREGDLVPDTCEHAQIVVPVRGQVRLALLAAEGIEAPQVLRTYPLAPTNTHAAGSQRTVDPEPWLLTRNGTVDVGGRLVPLYEGWIPMDVSSKVLFRLPGQRSPQEVDLAGHGVLQVKVTKG